MFWLNLWSVLAFKRTYYTDCSSTFLLKKTREQGVGFRLEGI